MASEVGKSVPVSNKQKRLAAAEERRSIAAQDSKLEQPPEDAKVLPRGIWLDLPNKKLLELVAYHNCGNWTGDLDWCKRGTQLSKPLQAMTNGFCDNIVLRCLVPPEHVKCNKEGDCRTQEYIHFGERCKTIREIIANVGITIPADNVTGVRLFAVSKQPKGSIGRRIPEEAHINSDTVILRGAKPAQVEADGWYWQNFKVTLCDADLQQVIDLVRSGAFAKHGLWLNDFDVTIDCAGVVRVKELIPWLLKPGGGFWREGKTVKVDADDWDSDGRPVSEKAKKIMDNAHKVGHNCITWVQRCKGQFIRVKAYIKLVQEFEKQSVRSTVGNHISDWIEMSGNLLASARDATEEEGLMRSETTIYVDCDGIPIHKAHLYIPETAELMTAFAQLQIAAIPAELVLRVPHRVMVANWCAAIVHTLVVVDIYYDNALVCYAKNEVTHTVSGIYVTGWQRRGKYVLQRLALGEHPVDVLYLSRGSKHEPIRQEIPGEDKASKKLKTDAKARLSKSEKARAKEDDAIFNWVDADADLGNGQQSIQDCLAKPAGGKRKLEYVDSDAEEEDICYMEEAEEAEPEEEQEEQEEEQEEQEEEAELLDTEAQVAAAVAVVQASAAAELKAAQEAVQADTTSTLDPGETMRVAADPGTLVAFTRRYHRVPIKTDDACITEFPPGGGLEHAFCLPEGHANAPELLPINPDATTKEQKSRNLENKNINKERVATATRAVVEQHVRIAGFRPVEEMNTVLVHTRVAGAPPISNKIHTTWLVDAASGLELDMSAITGATKRGSFALKSATRKKRKEKLLKQRQKERLANVANGAAERPEIVRQKRQTTQAVELKQHLRSLYTGSNARSLRSLDAGEYPLVAVRVHEPASEDRSQSFDIFLKMNGSAQEGVAIEPFKATEAINEAFTANALKLAPWYNALGDGPNDRPRHGVYYLDPNHTTTAIGTFVKANSAMTMANGKSFIDCGVSVGDVAVMLTTTQQRDEHAANGNAADEMETEAQPTSAKETPPPLLITDELKRCCDYLAKEFPVAKGGQPRVFTVCKMGTTDYYGHTDKIMLEVKEQEPGSKAVIVWGGPTLNDRAAEISRDCVLVVRKVLQRNAVVVDIVAADSFDFTYTLPKYATLPALRKGKAAGQPAEITIAAVGSVKVDKAYNPVIQDSDGKVWRFAAPQNIKPNEQKNQPGLQLRKGAVLDTINMTVSATGTSDTSEAEA